MSSKPNRVQSIKETSTNDRVVDPISKKCFHVVQRNKSRHAGEHDLPSPSNLLPRPVSMQALLRPFHVIERSSNKHRPQMENLADELITYIGTFLDVCSLKVARVVNRRLKLILSSNQAGWMKHCARLWERRIHVSQDAVQLLTTSKSSTCAIEAYRLSCTDGRLRHEITLSELCFDPTTVKGTIWQFRFKEAAGPEWTSFDPWHAGRVARSMVFLRDGTVGELFSCASSERRFEIRLPFSDAIDRAGLEIRWKIVSQPVDLPMRRFGAYLRLNIAGRDVPTYIVHRSPNSNWGFLMENCWGVFASFRLPLRKLQQPMAPARNPQNRMRLRRSPTGNVRWIYVEEEDVESDDDDDAEGEANRNPPRKRMKYSGDGSMLDDASLMVTTHWQWREAMLYNLGAVFLPDGPCSDVTATWWLNEYAGLHASQVGNS